MSDDTRCCPLSGHNDGHAKVYNTDVIRARKEHRCCECRLMIKRGQMYERVTGLWGERWDTYNTCLLCKAIRDHFNCEGFIFESLWEDLEQNLFPDMKAGGECLSGLPPAARGFLIERRLSWVFKHETWEPAGRFALPPGTSDEVRLNVHGCT